MDWNWFFSAVAQSSAAIVGIFGAYILTNIINNKKEYNENIYKITDLSKRSHFIKSELHSNYIFMKGRSAEQRLYEYPGGVPKQNELISKLKELRLDIHSIKMAIQNNPQHSKMISYFIILMTVFFFIGVIYPLHFLPINDQIYISFSLDAIISNLLSLKGLILILISVIYLLIAGILYIENNKLVYDKNLIDDLSEKIKFSYYTNFITIIDGYDINEIDDNVYYIPKTDA
ncbi:hypothetical protein ACFL6H_06420 [Candidatus Latescibacterota bacterium]